ncbi:hypothetical protein OIDMADRAFT_56138 [Oidiodendron maius Zn]|uniref:LicD/FKTN/FKRP nucleotidyltransferase domain-containing protein n=1 Tax=Oidiodendron maius (strain Zn) TaxID=913774 RepID=A0A0C3H6M4_OIDMZ|nr:hypothetical protein OIDMADRAFT_56138 [Oidiodendron maius Zn]
MKLHSLLFASTVLFRSILAAPSPAKGPGHAFNQHGKPQGPQVTIGNKYFYEAGGTLELSHYDVRYYQGQPVSYEERTDSLHHLVRAYLTTFRERNIETWIAHGTLLGWWWNGRVMPWDWDLDTQVSASTLTWLGENLNMTVHNYTAVASDGSESQRQYLLDINPNHVDRQYGNGLNVIDARWVDVRNGLFIDITGLSETRPTQQPGVWSCKNFHRYNTRDLYPLRETMFEGVPALVPYAFDKVLTDEYSQNALKKTFHEGHRWIPEEKEWIPEPNGHER